MDKLFSYENTYLSAKLMYYKGTPIMSDTEFDALEKFLNEKNSKVTQQVGYKSKDFNFTHPTKMLSLSKIQTELNEDGSTNYMENVFFQWFNKRNKNKNNYRIMSSPKFDGNGVNAIFIGGKFTNVITRGGGDKGKDVTDIIGSIFPKKLIFDGELKKNDVIEIRCEIVIDKFLFEQKYKNQFANPRNYVAGVIGADVKNEERVSELVPIALHFKLNGKFFSSQLVIQNDFVKTSDYQQIRDYRDFIEIIKEYEELRPNFKYQLDGVVFAFEDEYREELGENSHDPEWSVAIKFIPEEAVTDVIGISWNVGKTGELAPVILLKPVQLAGTTVKRVSGYNHGFIINNKLGLNSTISCAKAGEIVPEIQSVIIESEDYSQIPTICPNCGHPLSIDGIHLMCNNEKCSGRVGKQLSTNAKMIQLKGVGPKTLDWFSTDFDDLIDLIVWVRKFGNTQDIENYGIKFNSKSHQNFLSIFNNIKTLTVPQVIVMLGYNNVGLKLAEQVSKLYAGQVPDWTSQDKSLVQLFYKDDVKQLLNEKVTKLESVGVTIEQPIEKVISNDTIFVCLTGSPKEYGYATKEEFLKNFNNVVDTKITDKQCNYLITDDMNSTSSKMKTAEKKGITIMTYSDFYNKMK